MSIQTPINLLGRDALCKIQIQIWCSPSGVYIDKEGLDYQMMMQKRAEKTKVYWLGGNSTPVTQVLEKWGKYIQAQIPKASKSSFDFHCTVFYDETKSKKFEEEWDKFTKGIKVELVSRYILI